MQYVCILPLLAPCATKKVDAYVQQPASQNYKGPSEIHLED